MSRIGNSPVEIPKDVEVKIQDKLVSVKGKLGELSQTIESGISVSVDEVEVGEEQNKINVINLKRASDSKENKSKHGLYRALLNNMIEGVSKGFSKELELVGVGYRASAQGQKLELSVGFSHTVVFLLAPEIKAETVSEKGKNPIIKLSSFDKQLLGQVVAKIRSLRPPEPYKGKGIKYVGENVRRKDGKAA